MSNNTNSTEKRMSVDSLSGTPKDAYGYDAISTYLPLDNLGINALADSEKYKRGIKENRTGRTRTLGIWMECPKCGISSLKQQYGYVTNIYVDAANPEVSQEALFMYMK